MKNLRQTFADLMLEIGSHDESLVVIVGDISHGILQPFAKKFPDRYFNIGICEPATVNIAAGVSKVGLNPVVHTIAPFLTERAYEQIKLDFGYQDLPVNIISVGGSFDYAKLGCSHHCYTDVSLFAHLAKSQIFLPGSSDEFSEIFKATYADDAINYYRLTENPHDHLFADPIVPGKGIKVIEGNNLTIVALGSKLTEAKEASLILKDQHGISSELIYYNSFKPFDAHLLQESVLKTKRFITIEELSSHGGLFAQCLVSLTGIKFDACKQMAVNDFIKGYGTHAELTKRANLDTGALVQNSLQLLEKNS
jgi:transketolase